MFAWLRRENPAQQTAHRLYLATIARARAPVFYTRFAVPDTIDGRFDLLSLHAFLVMEAVQKGGEDASELGTCYANAVFSSFEGALRDLGVSDFGLGKRIKSMANAFYGRLEVYRGAFDDEATLQAALLRNLYRGDETREAHANTLAPYMIVTRGRIAVSDVLVGTLDFGPLPDD